MVLFLHGWPELSISWRHQLPVFAGLGFRAIAPDMRGYGRSSTYASTDAYAQEQIVADMVELLDHLGAERAVWVGHDWGAAVAWNIASHHPERCHGVAALCVPYRTVELGLDPLVALVDRRMYPADEYPYGQWDYQVVYRDRPDRVAAVFDADPYRTVKALFRKGKPEDLERPAATAMISRSGGWFRGADVAPDLPRDADVVSEADLRSYAAALARNGFRGPDAWYLNHEANAAYAAARGRRRQAADARAVPRRPLRRHLRGGELAARGAAARVRRRPHRAHARLRPLDAAGTTRRGERRAGRVAAGPPARRVARRGRGDVGGRAWRRGFG